MSHPERSVPEGAAVFPLIPEELGVQPLLLAVLHAVVFLEGSSEEVVEPAAAEEALNYLAGYLQRLNDADRRRLREDLDCLVRYARQEKWGKAEVRFLQQFRDDFAATEEG
jgi:hypothetical protein